jgi:hypothetical protein
MAVKVQPKNITKIYSGFWSSSSSSSWTGLEPNMFLTPSSTRPFLGEPMVEATLHTLLRRRWPSSMPSSTTVASMTFPASGSASDLACEEVSSCMTYGYSLHHRCQTTADALGQPRPASSLAMLMSFSIVPVPGLDGEELRGGKLGSRDEPTPSFLGEGALDKQSHLWNYLLFDRPCAPRSILLIVACRSGAGSRPPSIGGPAF